MTPAFPTLSADEVRRMSPLELAYLGDTVCDLYVRDRLVRSGIGVQRMHRQAVARVNAAAQAEALELIVPEDAEYLGKTLTDLEVDADCLIAVIVRGNKVIVPGGSDHIEAGDHVVVITKRLGVVSLEDILK